MKHSEIRKKIIETASRLFYENGYNSTGINEIISEAGIAKATLYNHFKSKQDICIAYLQYKNDTFLKDISVFSKKNKEGKDQILSLFDFLATFFKDRDFNGCWCIKTVAEIPKEEETIRAEIQHQKLLFIRFIEGLVSKTYPNKNYKLIEQITKQVYLLYESAVSESHLHQNKWPIYAAKDICEKIV